LPIRDRTIKKQQWNKDSDWYSFAILTFQMWIGIHPFRGKHPDFKPAEWTKRMDKNISVFDSKVTLPKTCYDLSVIPKSHLGWFQDIFINGARCAPPKMGNNLNIAINAEFKFIVVNDSFEIQEVETCKECIERVFNFVGVNYIIGNDYIYKGNSPLPINLENVDETLMCESEGVEPIVCLRSDSLVRFLNTVASPPLPI